MPHVSKRSERYAEILPLVCHDCQHRWEQLITSEVRAVPCRLCRGSNTHIVPPAKSLDSGRANHYNALRKLRAGAKSSRDEDESLGPERVLRARVLEPVEIDEVIIEEIV